MPVTQDYKILTLTASEWTAVAHALAVCMPKQAELIALCNQNGIAVPQSSALLANMQSVYAKVRA